ncbi:hypothetical protein L484_019580 [Morus notabilis]|uniref:Prolamin-like domain-containing protein n=1 Tax=Morus notabilis TaxID=981085 RepID=W9RVZ5_9ROSA|nr:hypothetical protein L484_019580 [Morus notabilis]
MKKLSILVLFFFALRAAVTAAQPSNGNVNSQVSCSDHRRRIKPCVGEIFSHIRQNEPINNSSSCCAAILHATGECPRHLPRSFYKGAKYCRLAQIIAATPPKSSSPLPPPPQACPDLKRLPPCIKEIVGHRIFNRTIGSSCCATIVDIGDKCSDITWPWFTKPRDYCRQSYGDGATAKPPSRRILYFFDFPKFPKPTEPSQPPTPPQPQASSVCSDIPTRNAYLECMPQYVGHEKDKRSPINSTCCAILNAYATEPCPVGEGTPWSEVWPASVPYCQHPEQSQPSPLPPPPPSSVLPPPQVGANDCWSFLDTVPSCINEIMSGFFDINRGGIGPACCSSMSSWGEDCFSQLSQQLTDLFYPYWLRQQCSIP